MSTKAVSELAQEKATGSSSLHEFAAKPEKPWTRARRPPFSPPRSTSALLRAVTRIIKISYFRRCDTPSAGI
jgi:hypothetical protein